LWYSRLRLGDPRIEERAPRNGDCTSGRKSKEATARQSIFGDALFAHWGVSFGLGLHPRLVAKSS
ncbi:MAG: hypothetical protein ACXVIH_06285, partial [Ilumatobacteraceae bacterium]